jgi:hypothetical protein
MIDGPLCPTVVFTSTVVLLEMIATSPLPGTVPEGVQVQCEALDQFDPVLVVVQVFPAQASDGIRRAKSSA